MMTEEGPRPSEAYVALTLQDVRRLCTDVREGRIDLEPWREEFEDVTIDMSRLIGGART